MMSERFIEPADGHQAHDISASELLGELSAIDSQRADVERTTAQIDIAAIGASIELMAHEFGPKGGAALLIETLEGHVAVIEKQLSVLDSQAAIINQAMAEPQRVSNAAGVKLKEIYEQKRAIIRQIQDLKRQRDTTANRQKIQDLEYQNGFTIAPREAEAQNDQLHADAVIERLEAQLSIVVAGRDIRLVKLGVYESKIQQLKDKIEKVSNALGMLAGASSLLKDAANEADDWTDVALPERLEEIDMEMVTQLASYGDYSSVDSYVDDTASQQSPQSPANTAEFSDVVSIDAAYIHVVPEEIKQPDSIHPLLSEAVLKARRTHAAPKKSKRIKGFLRIN